MNRKPLISLSAATKLYGGDNVTFCRPSYVTEGWCQWCGNKIEGNRRKSFCTIACSQSYHAIETWQRTRGAYSNHILRRDNFTCQICGAFHAYKNTHGVYIASDDGCLRVHHVIYVCNGGTDDPNNLKTVCEDCHKEIHKNDKSKEYE